MAIQDATWSNSDRGHEPAAQWRSSTHSTAASPIACVQAASGSLVTDSGGQQQFAIGRVSASAPLTAASQPPRRRRPSSKRAVSSTPARLNSSDKEALEEFLTWSKEQATSKIGKLLGKASGVLAARGVTAPMSSSITQVLSAPSDAGSHVQQALVVIANHLRHDEEDLEGAAEVAKRLFPDRPARGFLVGGSGNRRPAWQRPHQQEDGAGTSRTPGQQPSSSRAVALAAEWGLDHTFLFDFSKEFGVDIDSLQPMRMFLSFWNDTYKNASRPSDIVRQAIANFNLGAKRIAGSPQRFSNKDILNVARETKIPIDWRTTYNLSGFLGDIGFSFDEVYEWDEHYRIEAADTWRKGKAKGAAQPLVDFYLQATTHPSDGSTIDNIREYLEPSAIESAVNTVAATLIETGEVYADEPGPEAKQKAEDRARHLLDQADTKAKATHTYLRILAKNLAKNLLEHMGAERTTGTGSHNSANIPERAITQLANVMLEPEVRRVLQTSHNAFAILTSPNAPQVVLATAESLLDQLHENHRPMHAARARDPRAEELWLNELAQQLLRHLRDRRRRGTAAGNSAEIPTAAIQQLVEEMQKSENLDTLRASADPFNALTFPPYELPIVQATAESIIDVFFGPDAPRHHIDAVPSTSNDTTQHGASTSYSLDGSRQGHQRQIAEASEEEAFASARAILKAHARVKKVKPETDFPGQIVDMSKDILLPYRKRVNKTPFSDRLLDNLERTVKDKLYSQSEPARYTEKNIKAAVDLAGRVWEDEIKPLLAATQTVARQILEYLADMRGGIDKNRIGEEMAQELASNLEQEDELLLTLSGTADVGGVFIDSASDDLKLKAELLVDELQDRSSASTMNASAARSGSRLTGPRPMVTGPRARTRTAPMQSQVRVPGPRSANTVTDPAGFVWSSSSASAGEHCVNVAVVWR